MNTKFAYCFDENLANELSKTNELFKEDVIDNKKCWIFIVNNILNFNELDKTKIFISNRLNF